MHCMREVKIGIVNGELQDFESLGRSLYFATFVIA